MGTDNEGPDDGVVHDEVEIEDFEFDPSSEVFTYPCPCGDEFVISKGDLANGDKYARCPSCSLMVLVIFNPDDLESIVDTKSAKKESKSGKNSSVKAVS